MAHRVAHRRARSPRPVPPTARARPRPGIRLPSLVRARRAAAEVGPPTIATPPRREAHAMPGQVQPVQVPGMSVRRRRPEQQHRTFLTGPRTAYRHRPVVVTSADATFPTIRTSASASSSRPCSIESVPPSTRARAPDSREVSPVPPFAPARVPRLKRPAPASAAVHGTVSRSGPSRSSSARSAHRPAGQPRRREAHQRHGPRPTSPVTQCPATVIQVPAARTYGRRDARATGP